MFDMGVPQSPTKENLEITPREDSSKDCMIRSIQPCCILKAGIYSKSFGKTPFTTNKMCITIIKVERESFYSPFCCVHISCLNAPLALLGL